LNGVILTVIVSLNYLKKDSGNHVKESSNKYLFVLVLVDRNPYYKCGADA